MQTFLVNAIIHLYVKTVNNDNMLGLPQILHLRPLSDGFGYFFLLLQLVFHDALKFSYY